MASYAFKALDLAGASTKGEMEAGDKQAVAAQLRSKGLIVIDIEEQSPASAGDILARFRRVKADELVIATRQLATMVNSGMSLLRSLYIIEEQTENDKLREIWINVRKDVEAGLALSDALRKHPDLFNDLYVAMVEAGETGGILDSTLLRVADQLEKDAALRREIKAAMIYPSLIGGFAFVVLFALVAFLVPVFEKIFKDFGGELPAITKFTVFLSHLFTERFYVLFGGIAAIIFIFRRWKNSEGGRMQWDRLKLKFPMKIGDIVQKVALARFSRTFSGLIAAGVPMLEAIEITGKTSGNKVIEKAMDDVRDSVKKGGSLTAPMMLVPEAFPIMVTQMIGVGEETGALETMMSKIADFYEEQVATAVKALTSILEPIMIVFVGGIVGFIVIAMYLPMFKVYDSIKSRRAAVRAGDADRLGSRRRRPAGPVSGSDPRTRLAPRALLRKSPPSPPAGGAARSPRPQARPPGRHGASVRVILLAVARAQRRLFVAPHECGDDEPERGRVREQERASENERLAHDCCADGEVHRISHMAIQPADHEPLRRRRRGRRPTPLEDEAAERMQEDASAESDQSRAEYDDGSRRLRGLPASQQPRHEAGHHAGRHEEEQDAAECGLRSAHAASVRPSAEPLHQPLLLARSSRR